MKGFLRVRSRVLAGAGIVPLVVGALSLNANSLTTAYAAGQANGQATYVGTTAPAQSSGSASAGGMTDATFAPCAIAPPVAP